jgi:hypothetical protein
MQLNFDMSAIHRWVQREYESKAYPIQDFNLIGIRDEEGLEQDIINDWLGFWTEDEIFLYNGTTDPSVFYTKDKNERNPNGTFHLGYGWHEKIWIIGTHKGYEAFQNHWKYCKPTRGWRDANFNFKYDEGIDKLVTDYIGVNFHRMSALPNVLQRLIGRYSAGCQVVNDLKDFQYILQKAKDSNMFKQNNFVPFNYCLFSKEEVGI